MKHITLMAILFIVTGCASTQWNATNHHDEFTNTNICRVEQGTKAQKDFARGFTGIYFTQNFYAENNNGEIRAGCKNISRVTDWWETFKSRLLKNCIC